MPDLNDLALWDHQRAAVDLCQAYFASASNKSALVHLPTGAGKTGVMAVLASQRAMEAPVLVVCPSAALVGQLEEEFAGRFWDKIGADAAWQFERTQRLTLMEVDAVLTTIAQAGRDRVAVFATIQALQQIHSSARYAELADKFGTVFFDEGHREPAPQWARAARDFGVPTILFSATPYRNDLKLFAVDENFVSFLSFQQAAHEGLIRPVEIDESALPYAPADFARTAVAMRDQLLVAGRIERDHKMIVRAGSEQEVDDLYVAFAQALRDRDDGILAIHNNFRREGAPGLERRGDVPRDLHDRAERFLIHQHMLTEGIDDPACTMLAVYQAFGNERQLVQQVGRLTRHPGLLGHTAPPAVVLARAGDGVEKMWGRFLDYDTACVDNDGQPPLRNERVVDDIIAALPELDYIEGRFRRRADLTADDLAAELRFPRAAVIFEVDPRLDLEEFTAAVSGALDEDDRFERRIGANEDGTCRYHLSIRLRQSPFLAESLFQTASLEATVYAHRGNWLFFYDSGGLWVDEIAGLNTRILPGLICSLLPQDDSSLTSLTMRNTDLGPLALRGRSIQARSLERSGVFMGEQTHVVTRAMGRFGKGRRALGLASGRMREGEGAQASLSEFSEWCDQVTDELRRAPPAANLFGRFATPVEAPVDTTPLNILVDLEAYEGDFVDSDGNPVAFDLESACADVVARAGGPPGFHHCFELTIDGAVTTVWICWDPKKRKYWLRSQALSKIHDRHKEKITLAHRLNRQQPFRVILGGATVFAYGRFYTIDLQLGRVDGPGALVLGLLHGLPELRAVTSEKGALVGPAATWPVDSVFGLIDAALGPVGPARPFGPAFPALVCDDLGEEIADFVGADDGPASRVVFIAAKWKQGAPGAGAATLYDVCGQALKNLAYLKADAQSLPGAPRKWDNDWILNGGRVPRRRVGPGALAFRRLFARVRANPTARREVWLVLGGGSLSKRAVEAAFAANPPRAHVLQLFHLLLSVYAGCQSIGVELKVFCAD